MILLKGRIILYKLKITKRLCSTKQPNFATLSTKSCFWVQAQSENQPSSNASFKNVSTYTKKYNYIHPGNHRNRFPRQKCTLRWSHIQNAAMGYCRAGKI